MLWKLEACEMLGKSVAVWAERKLRQKKPEEEKKAPNLQPAYFYRMIFLLLIVGLF
jgi:hypothetical protein